MVPTSHLKEGKQFHPLQYSHSEGEGKKKYVGVLQYNYCPICNSYIGIHTFMGIERYFIQNVDVKLQVNIIS
jgi:hypothetical protein